MTIDWPALVPVLVLVAVISYILGVWMAYKFWNGWGLGR